MANPNPHPSNIEARKGRGRPKGARSKIAMQAKEMIEAAAEGLGGAERMLAWAQESPENEKAFWATIYPKLLPLTVKGPGTEGEHKFQIVWAGNASKTDQNDA